MSKARSTRVSRPDAGRCWLRCLRCLAQMLGPLRCWLRCLRCLAQITPIEGIEAQSAQHTGEPLLARPPRLPLSAGQMLAEMLTQMLGQMLGPLRCWLRCFEMLGPDAGADAGAIEMLAEIAKERRAGCGCTNRGNSGPVWTNSHDRRQYRNAQHRLRADYWRASGIYLASIWDYLRCIWNLSGRQHQGLLAVLSQMLRASRVSVT
jgi:hypothetical protein